MSNLFSQIWLKKRHTSLFSGICREIRTKFHQKFAEKMQKLRDKMKKIRNSLFIHEKMLTIFGWIEKRCKGVHCVDLVKSFPTSIYLQKSASIQLRTSLSKFGGKFNSFFICLLTGRMNPIKCRTDPGAVRHGPGLVRCLWSDTRQHSDALSIATTIYHKSPNFGEIWPTSGQLSTHVI